MQALSQLDEQHEEVQQDPEEHELQLPEQLLPQQFELQELLQHVPHPEQQLGKRYEAIFLVRVDA